MWPAFLSLNFIWFFLWPAFLSLIFIRIFVTSFPLPDSSISWEPLNLSLPPHGKQEGSLRTKAQFGLNQPPRLFRNHQMEAQFHHSSLEICLKTYFWFSWKGGISQEWLLLCKKDCFSCLYHLMHNYGEAGLFHHLFARLKILRTCLGTAKNLKKNIWTFDQKDKKRVWYCDVRAVSNFSNFFAPKGVLGGLAI